MLTFLQKQLCHQCSHSIHSSWIQVSYQIQVKFGVKMRICGFAFLLQHLRVCACGGI